MLCVRSNACPVDYSKCNQTVTVYHKDGETYTKSVIARAFLDIKKVQSIDKTGSKETNGFLLVIPCDAQCVFVGDKVLLGEGPDIDTREAWAEFVPAKVAGLVVVQYVDQKYWQSRMVHVEAGG